MEFKEFSKIARLSRDCTVTEKIDGTNAQIAIWQVAAVADIIGDDTIANLGLIEITHDGTDYFMQAGSRNRWISTVQDNVGFAQWVKDNVQELIKLGEGNHFGEWWGQGIQRNYGLKEKRFSLFNTHRWSDDAIRPACCHVVPIFIRVFLTLIILIWHWQT